MSISLIRNGVADDRTVPDLAEPAGRRLSSYVERWQGLRAGLERRRESRRKQRRFRHDPAGYLTELEQRCLQLSLPA